MTLERRTHMAGELRTEHIGQRVVLKGWVDGHRDLGSLIFFEVRDRSGKVQCVLPEIANDAKDSSNNKGSLYETARSIRNEFVVFVAGVVRERSNKNPKIPTGD